MKGAVTGEWTFYYPPPHATCLEPLVAYLLCLYYLLLPVWKTLDNRQMPLEESPEWKVYLIQDDAIVASCFWYRKTASYSSVNWSCEDCTASLRHVLYTSGHIGSGPSFCPGHYSFPGMYTSAGAQSQHHAFNTLSCNPSQGHMAHVDCFVYVCRRMWMSTQRRVVR